MFVSPNRIFPAAGRKAPQIALSNVVLPAPFEPIKATHLPAATVRLAPRTAAMPP
jgi:hypothetical protein